MNKKPSRVRVLMMPYQHDDDRDPVAYSGPATVLLPSATNDPAA
jgi:prophage regulatory protein